MVFQLDSWLHQRRELLEGFFTDIFGDAWPTDFRHPLQYSLQAGGKRVRPALTMAAWEAFDNTIEVHSPVLWPAAALELIHNYSLIHDDLPAMDDDELRRGRPTVHVAFDEASAILAGDALLTEAFYLLAQAPLGAEQRIKMVEILSGAAGYRCF